MKSSKLKSPFELFKNCSLPLNYFKTIGLIVSYLYLPDISNSKLAQIRGKVINSEHLKFLDFPASDEKISDIDIADNWIEPETNILESEPEKDQSETVTLEEGESINPEVSRPKSEPDSEAEDEDFIKQTLVPEARILRDGTSKIKPIKYSYLTDDPNSFRMVMKSKNQTQWAAAADEELSNIKGHDVWED
ncbi:hypothetical protein VP01_9768g1, partial [Puccinia sorghi]